MRNIAVIGVGNLGLRHLQSLSESGVPTTLYGVDPSENALNAAVKHIDSHPERGASITLKVAKQVADLPGTLDFVVVATGADVRLAVVRELLSSREVRFLLLEKVLFQKPRDYDECARLIDSRRLPTYVNCPRRVYHIYATVKAFFAQSPLRLMTVGGGEWGLGCNGIHFVDLFAFITGQVPSRFGSQLDAEVRASKRLGFVEFTGTMRGDADERSIVLTAGAGAHPRIGLSFFASDRSCVVDEADGIARLYEDYRLKEEVKFKVPYQSKLTLPIADALLETGRCGLTQYSEAAAIHLPFVDALIQHGRTCINAELAYAPIT